MGDLFRNDFSRGWWPSADEVNCPPNALLRADNCILDEHGILSVRAGSVKVNSSPFSGAVKSLFTSMMSGTRYRFTAAGNNVYSNGTLLTSGFSGTGVSFNSWMGQTFFTWSTLKKKYDGSVLRNWGVPKPDLPPNVTNQLPNPYNELAQWAYPTLITCQEGTAASDAGVDFVSTSTKLTPNATTARGTVTKTFTTARNLSVYSDGGARKDIDILSAWIKCFDPSGVKKISVKVDVEDGTFRNDYYTFDFGGDEEIVIEQPDETYIDTNYDVHGYDRYRVQAHREKRPSTITTIRNDKVTDGTGWTQLKVTLGQMKRVGSTSGKGWNTVKAIRVTISSNSIVWLDQMRITGGSNYPLTGKYKWRAALVKDFGTYVSMGPVSEASTEVSCSNGKVRLALPQISSVDYDTVWFYRMGGTLDNWYRVATSPVGVDVEDKMSDVDATILNIKAEFDNLGPPAHQVSIVGPYYDRMFCVTQQSIYPSARLAPDTYPSRFVIRVADETETVLWARGALNGIYIGTTKDIYRLDGTGAEYPDGTMDFQLKPLKIGNPPLNSNVVAQEGNQLIYLSADGWRVFNGYDSQTIRGDTDLLWRGYTRHGVEPVNITGSTARHRGAISKGILDCLVPEGASTSSSHILHRYNVSQQRWYRHTYTPSFTELYREEDGTLLAGDTAGFVWQLDTGTADNGLGIPVVVWTKLDDNNQPLNRKDPNDHQVRVDTGGVAASVNLHLDGSASSALTISATRTGEGVVHTDIKAIAAFRQIQHRITGSFNTFKLYSFNVNYIDLPALHKGKVQNVNGGYPCEKVMSGIQLRVNTLGVARVFTPYLDNVAQSTFSLTTHIKEPLDTTFNFTSEKTGREINFSVDGEIELYSWEPVILYKLPCPKAIWDTGYVDLGRQDLTWIREIRIKVKTPANLVVTPYFDDVAWTPYTAAAVANQTTIYVVPVGREYKGKQPRITVTAGGSEFYPYWLEFYFRPSGNQNQKQSMRIKA